MNNIDTHPFKSHPNRTLLALSIPVLLSMTAEPITALVDTAFISSLGVNALAALGVGTTALSSLFWIFNFLGIGTQTEVAQVFGKGKLTETSKISSLALTLAFSFGLLLILLLSPALKWLAEALGASGDVQIFAIQYMRIRLFGAPAVLLMLTTFGVLRGLQDMRTPLWIALGMNVLNLLLDWLLIFGNGPFPQMGVAGSALASTISQWLGAIAGVLLIIRKLGFIRSFDWRDALKLLKVGGDVFVRTAMVNIFLLFTTRAANNISPDAGAAHQVIRQVYMFTALALDAYASTVQSLVGFFFGQKSVPWAKKVARVGLYWSLGTGSTLGLIMWLGRDWITSLLVPAAAIAVFLPAWGISAINQPINAMAFLSDGVLWGIGDYPYLRNAMIAATLIGLGGLYFINNFQTTLFWIWAIISLWVLARAIFGIIRIWPGIGNSIFKKD
ncbi:MAG: MATE family efflux transporter [Anaerolineaceae bacterium]|nr:MATE family efflux transporter [Anaerolineaceae bacterium]